MLHALIKEKSSVNAEYDRLKTFIVHTTPYRLICSEVLPSAHARSATLEYLRWSALVNIPRKALLSSVGFRKRMTSRSPRSF